MPELKEANKEVKDAFEDYYREKHDYIYKTGVYGKLKGFVVGWIRTSDLDTDRKQVYVHVEDLNLE